MKAKDNCWSQEEMRKSASVADRKQERKSVKSKADKQTEGWITVIRGNSRIKPMKETNKGVRLNIGGGIDKKDGFVCVDRLPNSDIVLDVEKDVWPWADDSVDEIVAEHVIEHLHDFTKFMNNCWRVLKKGCSLTVTTPHPMYEWYWQDPTHIRGYTANTFTIYCKGHPKTTHTGLKSWSDVTVTQRIFRVNDVQACEIKAVLVK